MTTNDHCPCGQDVPYADCCEPLHKGAGKATTAERLMRSRYAAFAKGQVDYLLETLHPSKRNETDRNALTRTLQNTSWLKLSILESVGGREADTEGIVEFVAFYESDNIDAMRERSRFLKENGVWYYVDGQFKKPDFPGRNDPCWCGSGKKSKKCHGAFS